MNSIYYSQTTYWVILVDLIVLIATVLLFRSGKASLKTQLIVGLVFIGFIAFMHWVFGGQNLLPADISGGAFYLIILGGAGLGVLLFALTSMDIFDKVSQDQLQIAQGLRVFVGGGFMMEGVLNVIPGWFSIMDGFFHIASGFLALVAALAFVKKQSSATTLLWTANIIGILDIVTIVTSICFVVWDDLGPFHNMNYVVFGAGPVLLWIHYMSIKKLIQS